MTDQEQAVAEQLQALLAQTDRIDNLSELEEFRASVETDLGERLATLRAIQSQNYRGAAGPESDDERVVAEINGKGALVSMEISPLAMRDMDAGELSRACTEALDAARAALSAELQERVTGLIDTDIGSSTPIVDVAEAFQQVREKTWPS